MPAPKHRHSKKHTLFFFKKPLNPKTSANFVSEFAVCIVYTIYSAVVKWKILYLVFFCILFLRRFSTFIAKKCTKLQKNTLFFSTLQLIQGRDFYPFVNIYKILRFFSIHFSIRASKFHSESISMPPPLSRFA